MEKTIAIQNMINWMETRKGKIFYSMEQRLGPNSYDCSSAVYFALQEGGFLPTGTMGNTDTLFNHLEQNGWSQIVPDQADRGDIFIWGVRGGSSGASGHTGIFTDHTHIIHCNYSNNGISEDIYETVWQAKGNPVQTIYRYSNQSVIDPESYTLVPLSGTFLPNIQLPVCAQPTQASPALDYYPSGSSIRYDGYVVNDSFIWVSYIAYSGNRRYVAIGPNDATNTLWGSGFDKTLVQEAQEAERIPKTGTFVPSTKLPVYEEPTKNSLVLAYYESGTNIQYDSYVINDNLIWISYIAYSGNRRYVAIGKPGQDSILWGSGFSL
ncbi:hypothetical protein C815_01776 [Firmicutes bacterium M10-2]|nr:hypothetical protein C815_01776 [Firmicutes bacterium M10-2]